MDDLPIGLFRTMGEARAFARRVKPHPTDKILRLFHTDAGTPCGISVTEFRDGKPIAWMWVRRFFASEEAVME